MAVRTIQAPGIQVNEIDRSQYDNVTDVSMPNSPNCFILGFADKGDDYSLYRIDDRESLTEKYGYPQNEAERYFYNGCIEILDRGAKLLAAKLPYVNNSKDKFAYVDYKIDKNFHEISTDVEIVGKWNTINDVRSVFLEVMNTPEISVIFGDNYEVKSTTIPDMRDTVNIILESNIFKEIKEEYERLDIEIQNEVVDQFVGIAGTSTNATGYYHKYICNDPDPDTKGSFLSVYYEATDKEFDVDKIVLSDVVEYIPTLEAMHKNVDDTERYNNSLLAYNAYQEFKKEYVNFENLFQNVELHTKVETITQLRDAIKRIVNSLNESRPYIDLRLNDSEITSYCEIIPDIDETTKQAKSGMLSIDQLDEYLTNNYTDINNKIRIVDITRNQYETTPFATIKTLTSDISSDTTYAIHTNDCLGIVPVVVAPTNALYFQNLIEEPHNTYFNGIANFNSMMAENPNVINEITKNTMLSNLYIELKNNESDSPTKETLSKMVADCFPQIERANPQHYDKEHFKKIGIVVLSAFIDNANNQKVNFSILESFVGSLDKYAKSTTDNSSIFIDNVVNTNSKYIRCFSAANTQCVKQASIIAIKNQTATSLGFYKADCDKNIKLQQSILTPCRQILDNMKDTRGWQVDIIVDSGLTNIGEYLEGKNTEYSIYNRLIDRPKKWWAISKMFDEFCKFTRKDCMYLLDAPRPFCLEGDQKIVRRSKPTNTIIDNIVPKLKYLTGINSSYTAGYCNWFKCLDDFSQTYFWCPPSIKAAGVYCYTDIYYHPWDAPAGVNRGKLLNAVDTAFSPTNEEAGRLYTQCWNYAINYPSDGIILEGQRTFQRKATALDRINVRRLMLWLEKQTVEVAKYYLYEGHTSYLRQRFKDALTKIFEKALSGYGISDYIIKCDEDNNTSTTIDRNELHCSIAVKPVKAVEFIVLNFIVTNQSADVSEEVTK